MAATMCEFPGAPTLTALATASWDALFGRSSATDRVRTETSAAVLASLGGLGNGPAGAAGIATVERVIADGAAADKAAAT